MGLRLDDGHNDDGLSLLRLANPAAQGQAFRPGVGEHDEIGAFLLIDRPGCLDRLTAMHLVPTGTEEVCNSLVAQIGCLDDEDEHKNLLPTAVGYGARKRRCQSVFREPLIHRR